MSRARANLYYRALVDGGLLYDEEAGEVHHLNATAALVWEGCQQGWDAGRIADELCRRFAVDAARARADVQQILAQFIAGGLLA